MNGIPFTPEEQKEIMREIIEAMTGENALPFTQAIQYVGRVSQTEAYEWRKECPEFEKDIKNARAHRYDGITDLAENKARDAIKEGDGKMIRFWLETKGKERGFAKRTEHAINDFRPSAPTLPETEEEAMQRMNDVLQLSPDL